MRKFFLNFFFSPKENVHVCVWLQKISILFEIPRGVGRGSQKPHILEERMSQALNFQGDGERVHIKNPLLEVYRFFSGKHIWEDTVEETF